MRKLSCFYFILPFLFCFQSWAVESLVIDTCKSKFQNTTGQQVLSNYDRSSGNPLIKEASLKFVGSKASDVNREFLINFIPLFSSALNIKKRLLTEWKNQVLENLPQFSDQELLRLFNELAGLSGKLDLEYEQDFFRSLKKASITYIPDFNKTQLVNIIWVLVQLDIKPPEESFVYLWRDSAKKKRREFASMDRYVLQDWFQKLEIPPQSIEK